MNAERRTNAERNVPNSPCAAGVDRRVFNAERRNGHLAVAMAMAVVVLAGCGAMGPAREAVPAAATSVLYGRVVGSDHTQPVSPAEWQARVTAEYEDGTTAQPHDRESGGDLFAFKVIPGKRVRLYFEAVPYQATVTEFLDVSRDDSNPVRVPDVVMDRIRWTMALFAKGNGEAFGRNLEAQAAMAESTGSADIFVANLEYYRKASARFPDCMKKIEAFEKTPRFAAITRQAVDRGVPVAHLKALVMSPAELAREDPGTLQVLASAPQVAASLRRVARQALDGTTPPAAPVAPVTPAARTPRR